MYKVFDIVDAFLLITTISAVVSKHHTRLATCFLSSSRRFHCSNLQIYMLDTVVVCGQNDFQVVDINSGSNYTKIN